MNKYAFFIVLNLIVIFYYILVLKIGFVSFGKFDNRTLLYNIFMYIIVSPIFEEYLFRGLILKYLLHKIKIDLMRFKTNEELIVKISIANILTSILFAVVHFMMLSTVFGISIYMFIASTFYFVPSIVLGMLYETYKKLYFPIEFHMLLNFNVFLVYFL